MSISSRITQMEQHIGNAYDGLEDLGVDLTDVDKNIDNIASKLQDVWNGYPKVTATDVEETMLEGTKAGRMEIDLKGQTSQETLTGKNLFTPNVSIIGKTYNNSTDLFTFHRDSGLDYLVSINDLSLKPNTNYVLYMNVIENTMTDTFRIISYNTYLRGTFSIAAGETGVKTGTLTTESSTEGLLYDLWFYCNSTGNLKTKIMLVEGTTAGDYEPYCGGIPSPNPVYPQTIHNVIGSNEFKIQNKNLAIPNHGSYNVYRCIEPIPVKTGDVLTYIVNFSSQYTSNMIPRIYADKEMTQLLKEYSTFAPDGDRISVLNITDSGYFTLAFGYGYPYVDFNKLFVAFGTYTIADYVEHKEQNLPFDLKSKNLFDYANYTYDKTIFNAYRFIEIKGLKPNTQYSIYNYKSLSESGFDNVFLAHRPEYSGISFANLVSNSYIRFITDEQGKCYLCAYASNWTEELWNTFIDYFEEAMFVKGIDTTSYEPYYDVKAMQGTTLEDDGIHQKRKQRIFDGTENWYQYGNNVALAKWDNKETPTHTDGSLQGYKCNIAIETTGASQEKTDYAFATYNSNNIDFIVFHINMTVADWKAYLAEQYANGTPVIVEHKLAEEEIITYKGVQQSQYNAIKKAQSYDDQTNIIQTNEDLPFILNIEALKK